MWPRINFSEREVVPLTFSYDKKDFGFNFAVVLNNIDTYNLRRITMNTISGEKIINIIPIYKRTKI